MEKATPISEIQQRKESAVPPVANASPEIQEDEKAINETLRQFNVSQQNNAANIPTNPQVMTDVGAKMQQNVPISSSGYSDMGEEDYEPMMAMQHRGHTWEGFDEKKDLLSLFCKKSELKRMFIVMVVFVLMSLLPLETYMQKYIDLARFPYAGILVKGFLAGLFFMVAWSLF